ncbi:hypothetical protein ACQ4M4_09765 [Leptolyngbya sp. AN02str]|uniref:hypothetical protein n=1 Tax=Leptolyngbya sp. AN02str TaxID=3423363 RepID=UPI003D31091F
MFWTAIINSLICLLGAIGGGFVTVGSTISIANMTVPWAPILLGAAFLVPVMFVISGIGVWIALLTQYSQLITGLMVLPWAYAVVFVAMMLISFRVMR